MGRPVSEVGRGSNHCHPSRESPTKKGQRDAARSLRKGKGGFKKKVNEKKGPAGYGGKGGKAILKVTRGGKRSEILCRRTVKGRL